MQLMLEKYGKSNLWAMVSLTYQKLHFKNGLNNISDTITVRIKKVCRLIVVTSS